MAKTNAEQTQNKVIGELATDDAEAWFDKGKQQCDTGDFEEAIASYDRAIELKHDYYQAWSNRGMVLHNNLVRYEEALASFDRAIEFKHDDSKVWFNRGVVLRSLVRYEEAIASYDRAIELKHDYCQAWFNRGTVLHNNLVRYEEALASFDKALELKHDYYIAWFNRGVVLRSLVRYEEAIASYDRAIEFKHDYCQAWSNRGDALRDLVRYEEALASYDKALEFKADYYYAWNTRGDTLRNLERYEEALASYDKALEFKANDYYAWCDRSNVLRDLVRYEEALASSNKAIEFKADYYYAWNTRGDALRNLERYEEALASYDKALEFKANDYYAWCDRSNVLRDLGRYEEALASSNKAIEFKADYYYAWNTRGDALRDLERYEEALTSYNKAIEFKADYYYAWCDRSNVLRDLGRYEEALASSNKAIEFKADYYYAWNTRGDALRDLERYEEALTSYNKALEFKADYYYAWGNRGIALIYLFRYEEAIASYDKALEFKHDDDYVWGNRGLAASQSVHCNQLLASMSKIATRNPNLNQRGYKGELASYEEGLKYCHQDTHPKGWGRLHHYIGIAHYGKGRLDSRPRSYYRQAIVEYNLALQTLTKDNFPELHLEVLKDLIKAYLGLGQTAEAEEVRRLSSDLLRSLLEQPNRSARSKQQLALKFIGFQQLTVDRAVRESKLLEALELAESGKNTCLSWLLDVWGEDIPKPSWEEIKQLINPSTAIVYWHLSPYALHAFIVKDSASEPIVLDLTANKEEIPPQVKRLNSFETWVKDWNQQYLDYRDTYSEIPESHSWRRGLSSRLSDLAQILNIPGIEAQLEGVTHLILIPHRDLHRFPLHVLFSKDFTITYLPSAYSGLKLLNGNKSNREIEKSRKASLLSVEVESSDLPFTNIQSAAIGHFFSNAYRRLNGEDINKDEVIKNMLSEHQFLNFTGHGIYNFNLPSNSGLVLGKELLTLGEINRLGEYRDAGNSTLLDLEAETVSPDLSHYQIAYLPACETALTGNQNITTEYVGIASCFLRQGVSCAISTLWRVNTLSTCLLTIKFYQILTGCPNFPNLDTLDVAVALKEAQAWLKTATKQNLLPWVKQLPLEKGRDRVQLIGTVNKLPSSDEPYKDPYYWAGFCVIGIPLANNSASVNSLD